jgi:hypothetical protein
MAVLRLLLRVIHCEDRGQDRAEYRLLTALGAAANPAG